MLLAVQLPAWLSFLSLGWCIVHALAFALVFYFGVRTGLKMRQPVVIETPPSEPLP